MTKSKWVRVMNGLYRHRDGNARISHYPFAMPSRSEALYGDENVKANPWVLIWTDWMNVEHSIRYPTLAAAKAAQG